MSREVQPQAVKEVPAEDFIKAYAAHLKSTDKVRGGGGGAGPRVAGCSEEQQGSGEAACSERQRPADHDDAAVL